MTARLGLAAILAGTASSTPIVAQETGEEAQQIVVIATRGASRAADRSG